MLNFEKKMFKCLKLLLFLFNLQQCCCMRRDNRIHDLDQRSPFTTGDRTEQDQTIGRRAPPATPFQQSPESSPVHESIQQYDDLIRNDWNRGYGHTFTAEELQTPEDPPEPYSDTSNYSSNYSSFAPSSAANSPQRAEYNLYNDLEQRLGNMTLYEEGESSTPITDEPNLYYTEENIQSSFGTNQPLPRSGRNGGTSPPLIPRATQARTRPYVRSRSERNLYQPNQ
ncbi:hypothetical protein Mgra_00008514 [Meloidogyne graminicola]|uniref:Uncharacterized protein n=1 Tax=Meloidogyne graminicola TaxID=189291 RepID=A0A8S9ZFM2_9BILA|nr:hypothetical protein Mgra_00008514 [Meloidogyne graminicola]